MQTVTLPKGPSYSSHSFPDQRAAPQPVHGLLEQRWAGAWGCVSVVAVGTMAGMWERGRGTSTAQDGCAALPPLPPLGTTALVTHCTALGRPSASNPSL